MRKPKSLKNENRGASLLAVLVVLVVVSAIAVIITKLTITNIQMKEVERGTKKNFYSAESVMDELYAGLSVKAATAMGSAYQDVLENYADYTAHGKNLQNIFKRNYMEALEKEFWDEHTTKKEKTDDTTGEILYRVSQYNVDKIRQDCIATAENKPRFITVATDPAASSYEASYDADYEEGIFTLKNIKVSYTDVQGYETTITTNLVFTTPIMNFNGGSQIKEFMKYCLIANNQIDVNSSNVQVHGSVYAGADGIIATNNSQGGIFDGKVILTRGTIGVQNGTSLSLGAGNSAIWAENIETIKMTNKKEASELVVNGDCYVADDLSLNGINGTVKLKGNYYGYNFQKNYGTADVVANEAQFSSAMLVNAKESKLDLQDLDYLMIAGRTFISRGNNSLNNDVMLGESLSVRTNQLAYYVPAEYINASDPNNLRFTQVGLEKFEEATGIANVDDFLNATKQVVAYHYVDKGTGETVNYYLNFKSEQDANNYFAAYCNSEKGSDKVNRYAANYVSGDAIILDDHRIFTLKGDIMYRTEEEASLQEKPVIIDGNWGSGGAYFDFSSQLAVKYKSLQLGLTETRPDVTVSNVRFDDTAVSKNDKTVSPMFTELIYKDKLVDAITNETGTTVFVPTTGGKGYIPVSKTLPDGSYQGVILVDNAGQSAFAVPVNYTQGIVVATGDVYVAKEFMGLIISGGKISFAANAKVTSDEMLVSELFAEDLAKPETDRLFSQFFKDCGTGSVMSNVTGSVDMKTYLTYENWKKN